MFISQNFERVQKKILLLKVTTKRLIKTHAMTYVNSQLLQGHQNYIICGINIGYT